MKDPTISGSGWKMRFDEETYSWEMTGGDRGILKMVIDRFPASVIEDEYARISKAEDSRPFGPIYEDVVDFLLQWGIKASVSGAQGAFPEEPPT